MDSARRRTVQTLLKSIVRDLDKGSDPQVARGRLRAVVSAVARDWGEVPVLFSERGAWVLALLTDEEKVAFAFALEPRLKRTLPAATWREGSRTA